jgi:hypothetical protein
VQTYFKQPVFNHSSITGKKIMLPDPWMARWTQLISWRSVAGICFPKRLTNTFDIKKVPFLVLSAGLVCQKVFQAYASFKGRVSGLAVDFG